MVQRAVAALGSGRWLLAVSGGVDSMVLLDAAAATLPRRSIVVATFHHGSGRWADRAAQLVATRAAALGLPCVVGRSAGPAGRNPTGRPTEARWRAARWRFLEDAAARAGAAIVTAHTRDDQIETVFMRALRSAGARGLAALYADSPIRRPLVYTSRASVAGYAANHRVPFLDDPANIDRRHLRVRVRLDILPAIEAVRPGFAGELLALAQSAADLRRQIEHLALSFTMMHPAPGLVAFERPPLRAVPEPDLRTLWPALAARAGVVMDHRGTRRLAAFTIEGETGQSIQLAGGIIVRMRRDAIAIHRPQAVDHADALPAGHADG